MADAESGRTLAKTGNRPAISVHNAFKKYGSNSKPVLINVNITVDKGTIYGLLGASGCGKTTLISCLVGNRKLNSGDLLVLGGKPGAKGSAVPGKRVGYMPQEIALYGEFSIKETIMYFGWIYGMKSEKILQQLQFLLNFLDLPSQNDFIKNLSGGQQRRVSFAVSLMHDPELLILDEPTVGVDPLLRQNIWDHLVRLTKVHQTTVLLTTHYIEEAGRAHKIGLMRSGEILAEESPQALLAMYRCNTLEDVFLKLIKNQDTANGNSEVKTSNLSLTGLHLAKKADPSVHIGQESSVERLNYHRSKEDLITDTINDSVFNITSNGKMRALLQKNISRIRRNMVFMLFIFALPVIQAILFGATTGEDPKGMKLAIVNMEMNGTECHYKTGCHYSGLSCRYLDLLQRTISQQHYPDKNSAINAVRTGNVWGVVYFSKNFTNAFVARMELGVSVDIETLDQSEIRVNLDTTHEQIAALLSRDLLDTYLEFSQGLLKDCDKNPKQDVFIQFNEPIYGVRKPSTAEYMTPGCLTSIVFCLAVTITGGVLINERVAGLLDRSLVAGVSYSEFMFSHIISQFFIICIQAAIMIFCLITVFGVTCNGSALLIFFITALQGINGMCFGFAISSVCELERNAIQIALGSFYPIILLSGTIWPMEGMPIILRYISYWLPLTQATTAVRCIMTRGWGLEKTEVYLGFVSTFCWIILFMVITLVRLKSNRS